MVYFAGLLMVSVSAGFLLHSIPYAFLIGGTGLILLSVFDQIKSIITRRR